MSFTITIVVGFLSPAAGGGKKHPKTVLVIPILWCIKGITIFFMQYRYENFYPTISAIHIKIGSMLKSAERGNVIRQKGPADAVGRTDLSASAHRQAFSA